MSVFFWWLFYPSVDSLLWWHQFVTRPLRLPFEETFEESFQSPQKMLQVCLYITGSKRSKWVLVGKCLTEKECEMCWEMLDVWNVWRAETNWGWRRLASLSVLKTSFPTNPSPHIPGTFFPYQLLGQKLNLIIHKIPLKEKRNNLIFLESIAITGEKYGHVSFGTLLSHKIWIHGSWKRLPSWSPLYIIMDIFNGYRLCNGGRSNEGSCRNASCIN